MSKTRSGFIRKRIPVPVPDYTRLDPEPVCDAERCLPNSRRKYRYRYNKQNATQFYLKTDTGTCTGLHTTGSGAGL
jgi:hypothetical protein